jgi:hypothetical protein
MIGESDCGEIYGIKIGRGNRSTRRKPPQRHFVHHKSHMARPGFELGPPRWEASDFAPWRDIRNEFLSGTKITTKIK